MSKANIDIDGTKATVEIIGDVVASAVQELRPQVKALIDKGVTEITIDFSRVSVIDSMGIGLLIAAYNSLSSKNGQITLVNASAEIKELMKEMRIDKRLVVL